MRASVPAVLGALGCVLLTGGCSNQEMAREAEARAKRWGVPAVQITRDLVYAEYGQRQLKLDVYRPPDFRERGVLPGIVVVRGGKWQIADKEGFSYIAGQMAMQGFVTACIEYRTADEAKFPAAVQDVQAAVRWLRTHAAEYGVDPGAIGAIGGSAGAHLVALLATTTPGELQAVVAMGGGYDLGSRDVVPEFTEAVERFIGEPLAAHAQAVAAASPIKHVSSRSAPLLLLHSTTDPVAPFSQAVEMEQSYRRAGAVVSLKKIEAPGIHGFWGDNRYFPETKYQAVNFFRRHLKVASH